ncbi:MAG: FAD-dependent oxidoreductase [Gammaproteobacteria bacterium]|nr:FAD-dependent oxidoreductase [Gammaproteobacteria bacterium]
MKPSAQVAVIGAGIAGLSCATFLQESGLTVSVFEKSQGPAGRMSTRGGENWQCDHGAQYFTARQPEFCTEVERWKRFGLVELWTPRLCVLGGLSTHDPRTGVERFVGTPCMAAPALFLAETLTVRTGATGQKLQRRRAGWQLSLAEGTWLEERFDAVLLALPAPQAVRLLPAHAPGLSALAGGARMHGCWALMLRFDTRVDLPFDAAFVNSGPLRWIARDNSKPGRGRHETWLLHASQDWSDARLEQDVESVALALLDAFRELGGPTPQQWSGHRWRYAQTESRIRDGCAWDSGAALGVCGDWLDGGRVEGAWMSGRKLAQRVLHWMRVR